jgi:nitroreductase
MGSEARRRFGLALGERKARKLEDVEAANAVRQRTSDEYHGLPAMIAVSMTVHENPEIREEDYAAVMMAIENILLAAVTLGLGTHVRTGAVLDDPAARAAIGAREGERVVATVSVGVPAELPPVKARQNAAAMTTWTD